MMLPKQKELLRRMDELGKELIPFMGERPRSILDMGFEAMDGTVQKLNERALTTYIEFMDAINSFPFKTEKEFEAECAQKWGIHDYSHATQQAAYNQCVAYDQRDDYKTWTSEELYMLRRVTLARMNLPGRNPDSPKFNDDRVTLKIIKEILESRKDYDGG